MPVAVLVLRFTVRRYLETGLRYPGVAHYFRELGFLGATIATRCTWLLGGPIHFAIKATAAARGVDSTLGFWVLLEWLLPVAVATPALQILEFWLVSIATTELVQTLSMGTVFPGGAMVLRLTGGSELDLGTLIRRLD